jgi:hypothetical protein
LQELFGLEAQNLQIELSKLVFYKMTAISRAIEQAENED